MGHTHTHTHTHTQAGIQLKDGMDGRHTDGAVEPTLNWALFPPPPPFPFPFPSPVCLSRPLPSSTSPGRLDRITAAWEMVAQFVGALCGGILLKISLPHTYVSIRAFSPVPFPSDPGMHGQRPDGAAAGDGWPFDQSPALHLHLVRRPEAWRGAHAAPCATQGLSEALSAV